MGKIGIATGGKGIGVSIIWAVVIVFLAFIGASKIYQDAK